MRDRARDLILPSLFNVAQSYEDYVHQYRLWEEEEDAHVPRGKTIVWIKYDRPPRQCVSRKRKAKVSTAITPPLQNDAADEQSGDETEVDETMANNAIKRAHRYQEILLKKRAKLSFKAQEDTPATPPQSVAYADATPKIASSIDAPSALAASRHGPSVLAASVETSSGTTEVQTGRSMRTSPCTSFDHSMHQLELSEDAKPRGLHQSAVSQMQFSNDVKPHHHLQPSYTPSNSLYQYPGGYPTIHVDWPHPSLEATQHASVIQTPASSSVVSPYLQNHVPYMYNNIYQSFGDGLPLDNDFSYGYQLPSQGAAASMPPQALLPFTGLPIEYTSSQAGTSQPVCQTPGMAHPVPMSHA